MFGWLKYVAFVLAWGVFLGIPSWNNFKDGLHEIGYDLGISEWQPRVCKLPKE